MAAIELVIGNKNYSSWSLRPWLAMRVAGIPFAETVVPLYRGESKSALLSHSPAGRVPVLKDGDLVIWESLAILEYLAERFPEARLWPADIRARAVARSVANEMHAGFSALRNHMTMNVRKSLPGRGRGDGVAEDIERITTIWRECRAKFGADGPYLFGAFSNVDAMFAPVVSRFTTYAVELDPTCAAYRDTVQTLPAMRDWADGAKAEPWTIDRYEVA